jgi:hypothetical protein
MPVEGIDRRSVNFNQYLIISRYWLLDLGKFQNLG